MNSMKKPEPGKMTQGERDALDKIDASLAQSRAERVAKPELKLKRSYRKREKPATEAVEQELLRGKFSQSRSA